MERTYALVDPSNYEALRQKIAEAIASGDNLVIVANSHDATDNEVFKLESLDVQSYPKEVNLVAQDIESLTWLVINTTPATTIVSVITRGQLSQSRPCAVTDCARA